MGSYTCTVGTLAVLLFLLGVTCMSFGLIGNTVINRVVRSKMTTQVELTSPTAKGYKLWADNVYDDKDAGAIRYFKGYVFNITNPVEVLEQGSKPILAQFGPYYYAWTVTRHNTSWSYDDDEDHTQKLRFITRDQFQFMPELSTCATPDGTCTPTSHIDESVTTINFAMSGVLAQLPHKLGDEAGEAADLLEDTLGAMDMLFAQRSVNDLAFGYYDELLASLADLGIQGVNPEVPGLSGHYNMTDLAAIPAQFSEVYTGTPDISKVARYTQWKNFEEIRCCEFPPCEAPDGTDCFAWETEEENTVQGTDCTLFGPMLDLHDGSKLSCWTEETNRSTPIINYDDEHYTFKDIKLRRFRVDKDAMQNASVVPSNAGYYMFGPSGILNSSKCLLDVPVFLSKPHFLDVDGSFNGTMPLDPGTDVKTRVVGLNPTLEDHDSFLDVDHWTGAAMHAEQRLQANVYIQPITNSTFGSDIEEPIFEKVAPVLIPLGWFVKGGQITDKTADEYNSQIPLIEKVLKYGRPCAFIAGGLLYAIAGVLVLHLWHRNHHKKKEAEDQRSLLEERGEANEHGTDYEPLRGEA